MKYWLHLVDKIIDFRSITVSDTRIFRNGAMSIHQTLAVTESSLGFMGIGKGQLKRAVVSKE